MELLGETHRDMDEHAKHITALENRLSFFEQEIVAQVISQTCRKLCGNDFVEFDDLRVEIRNTCMEAKRNSMQLVSLRQRLDGLEENTAFEQGVTLSLQSVQENLQAHTFQIETLQSHLKDLSATPARDVSQQVVAEVHRLLPDLSAKVAVLEETMKQYHLATEARLDRVEEREHPERRSDGTSPAGGERPTLTRTPRSDCRALHLDPLSPRDRRTLEPRQQWHETRAKCADTHSHSSPLLQATTGPTRDGSPRTSFPLQSCSGGRSARLLNARDVQESMVACTSSTGSLRSVEGRATSVKIRNGFQHKGPSVVSARKTVGVCTGVVRQSSAK